MVDPKNFASQNKNQMVSRQNVFKRLFGYFEGDQFLSSEKEKILPDAFLVTNYIEDYVGKYKSFLFPKNPRTQIFEVNVKSLSLDKNVASKYERQIMSTYRANNFFKKLRDQSLNFLIGGSSAFAFYPSKNKINFNIFSVDPTRTILSFFRDELQAVCFEEDFVDEKDVKVVFRTFLDSRFVIEYENDAEKRKWEHGLGIVPFAWVPDSPLPKKFEGRSLVQSLYFHDKQISETLTHFGRRVADNTDLELAIFSDKSITTKEKKGGVWVKRGRGETHHLGEKDDARFLEKPETNIPLEFIKFVEGRILAKTSIVSSAGMTKDNVSGYALSVQYNDMMDSVVDKRIPWDSAFRLLNRAILTWKFGVGGDYETDPVYHSPLPLDISQKITDTVILLDKGLISRFDAINELRAVDNPEQILKEIEEERKKYPPVVDNKVDTVPVKNKIYVPKNKQ